MATWDLTPVMLQEVFAHSVKGGSHSAVFDGTFLSRMLSFQRTGEKGNKTEEYVFQFPIMFMCSRSGNGSRLTNRN